MISVYKSKYLNYLDKGHWTVLNELTIPTETTANEATLKRPGETAVSDSINQPVTEYEFKQSPLIYDSLGKQRRSFRYWRTGFLES